MTAPGRKIAQKVIEMLNDGRLEEMLNSLKEKIPEIVKNVTDFTDKVIELVPKIGDLTERLLGLFGIETEAEKSRQALYDHRQEVDELAKAYGTDTETMITAITLFANENGLQFSEVVNNLGNYRLSIEESLNGMKQSYQTGTNDMWIAIADFANNNNTTQAEILSNWSAWEPQVRQWIETTGTDYKENFDKGIESLQAFAEENGLSLDEVLKGWQDHNPDIVLAYNDFVTNTTNMKDAVIQEVEKLGPETQAELDAQIASVNTSSWDNFWRGLKETAQGVWSFIKNASDPNTYTNPDAARESHYGQLGITGYASGGSVRAGQMYRVNDDHGRRNELFIPNVDGYILNGNDTQRVINNSTNNSRSYGDLIVNVNSYGADAASIADEIGAAVNQKLRMSGAW